VSTARTEILRAQALDLVRAGHTEREVADMLQIDLDQLRRLIGGPMCPGCDD
jgi:hypothetical protein